MYSDKFSVRTRDDGVYYHTAEEGWCWRGDFATIEEARKSARDWNKNRGYQVQIIDNSQAGFVVIA